jgi:hypothetical protein
MAKLYISEYAEAPIGYNGQMLAAGKEPSVTEQTPVVIGAGSLQSAAFNAKTKFVRIHTDAICSVAFGTSPTATANSKRLAANSTEYFGVTPGDKLAVITNS